MKKEHGKKNLFRVKLKGFDVKSIDIGVKSIVDAVKKTGATVIGPIPLPTKIEKFTVLRSPHVNKTSREQFEIRTHSRLIDVVDPSFRYDGSIKEIRTPCWSRCSLKTIEVRKMIALYGKQNRNDTCVR